MTKKIKKIVPFVLFIAFVASTTSCNRGMGCPNNFKIGDVVEQAAKALPAAATLIKK